MGGETSCIKNTNPEIPDNCKYCDKRFDPEEEVFAFFPHEGGGYCIFAPRDVTDYSCRNCAFKTCESCKTEKIRYGFIECMDCGIVHCWNNTDMKYNGNPMLANLELCDSMNCEINRKRKCDDQIIDNSSMNP